MGGRHTPLPAAHAHANRPVAAASSAKQPAPDMSGLPGADPEEHPEHWLGQCRTCRRTVSAENFHDLSGQCSLCAALACVQ
eukprot:2088801-Alexandrium_andersonii.AAC.1